MKRLWKARVVLPKEKLRRIVAEILRKRWVFLYIISDPTYLNFPKKKKNVSKNVLQKEENNEYLEDITKLNAKSPLKIPTFKSRYPISADKGLRISTQIDRQNNRRLKRNESARKLRKVKNEMVKNLLEENNQVKEKNLILNAQKELLEKILYNFLEEHKQKKNTAQLEEKTNLEIFNKFIDEIKKRANEKNSMVEKQSSQAGPSHNIITNNAVGSDTPINLNFEEKLTNTNDGNFFDIISYLEQINPTVTPQ